MGLGFFFEEHQIKKELKIGITGLLSNITTREGSHKGGWARLLKCQLVNMGYSSVEILNNKNSLSEYDIIIFDLGAEYSGTLNLFGGLDEKVFKRLAEILEFKGQLFSWKNQLPNVFEALKSRSSNSSTCEEFKRQTPEFLRDVQSKLEGTKVFKHAYRTHKLLISDSHGPSVWTPEYMIEREDGRTLYGALKNNIIENLLTTYRPDEVMIHMSNIDVRHHLCRQLDPEQSAWQMLNDLGQLMFSFKNVGLVQNVTLVQTVGIEDESRELPKTGYYKGTPFYGDWNRRFMIRDYMNSKMHELCYLCNKPKLFEWKLVEYPNYFFDKTHKLRFDVMEKPGSVHTSPEHYRWNLEKNELRWTENHDVKMRAHFGFISLVSDIEKDMYGSR